MPTTAQTIDFPFQREAFARYIYQSTLISCIPLIPFLGLGLILALVWRYRVGRWLPQRQVEACRCWLDGSTLRVDYGVYFIQRKAIPLDRITDLALAQGPLMRRFGLWSLRVQTAGTGMAEAILVGLAEPETVRDTLLQARARYLTNATPGLNT